MTIKTKEEMLLYVEADADKESGISFYLVSKKHQWYTGDEAVKICELVVEYEHPDSMDEHQIRTAAIQTLKEKQERIIAEAQLKKNKLQKKIEQLMLITYQPDTVLVVGKMEEDNMSPNMCKPHLGAKEDEYELPF